MPVLITGGLNAEAFKLAALFTGTQVIFADQEPMPFLPNRRSLVIPSWESPSFAHELLTVCLDHAITEVYPLKPGEIDQLCYMHQLFAEFGIELMIPAGSCNENILTYLSFETFGLAVLTEGKLIAGSLPPGCSVPSKKSGAFRWYLKGDNPVFTLLTVINA